MINESNREQVNLDREESGIIIVEAAIWFPMLLLAYLAFIVVSLYITQRIVLDRAVSQACLEATDWLSDTLKKYDEVSDFSGTKSSIRVNPYWNTIVEVTNPYSPMNESSFKDKVKERVNKYAKWSFIGRRKGVDQLNVDVRYDFHWVYGELVVNANQTVKLPLNLSLLGINSKWNKWEFRSTAKGMVFHTASLMNDVDFIFDAVRVFSGNKVDIKKARDFIGSLPDKLPH